MRQVSITRSLDHLFWSHATCALHSSTTTTTTTNITTMPAPNQTMTKAQHLAAIEQIEAEERVLREEIASKLAERSTLQDIINRLELPTKDKATSNGSNPPKRP